MKTSTPHKLQNSPLFESVKKGLIRLARKLFSSSSYSQKPVDPSKFTSEELAVWHAIQKYAKPRVTQIQLVHALHMIPKERLGELAPSENAMRKLRAIIHGMRLDHHCLIASDVKGYYIPRTELEMMEFLHRSGKLSKARIISERMMYRAKQAACGVIDSEFQNQQELF